MLEHPVIPFAVAFAASLAAAITDAWKYRIYNVLTWPLLASGLIYHGVSTSGMGVVPSLMGVCLGFAPMALLYLCKGLGAGDVKLMAGLGAWLGPVLTIRILYASWIAAGVYAVGLLLINAAASESVRVRYRLPALVSQKADGQISELVAAPDRRRRLIPFGVMILAGVVTTLISTGNVF